MLLLSYPVVETLFSIYRKIARAMRGACSGTASKTLVGQAATQMLQAVHLSA